MSWLDQYSACLASHGLRYLHAVKFMYKLLCQTPWKSIVYLYIYLYLLYLLFIFCLLTMCHLNHFYIYISFVFVYLSVIDHVSPDPDLGVRIVSWWIHEHTHYSSELIFLLEIHYRVIACILTRHYSIFSLIHVLYRQPMC